MTLRPELLSFETTDNLLLPALLFEPETATKRVVLFLHGNGSSSVFYKTLKMNLFGQELAKIGWSFMPFNNRGAHYIKKFSWEEQGEKREAFFGTALENIKDAVLDIEAAMEYVKTRGYEEIVLVGESTGANKIVVYNALQPDNTCRAFALVGGGDDTGLWYQHFGGESFWKILHEARARTENGTDQELLSPQVTHGLFTYRALADILDPDGLYNVFPFYEYSSGERLGNKTLFQEFRQLQKPTLILYGEADKYCYRPAREAVDILLNIHPRPQLLTGKVSPGADHSFSGAEDQEVAAITEWLVKIAA